ncbi:MAG TPA: hypothetical protein VFN71_06505 [Methylomirabilota bacterium]|nr:hypothetical protein [Methylomirabilota bacterium]
MAQLGSTARDEGGFFSLLRREPAKRHLTESELSGWVCRVLTRALAAGVPVRVRYRLESAQSADTFSFVPTELYARGAQVLVDGRSHPFGQEIVGLRVDRIFDARLDRAGEEPPPSGSRARFLGADDPGLYVVSSPPAYQQPTRRGRGLLFRLSLLLALGGVFGIGGALGGIELIRRYVGW